MWVEMVKLYGVIGPSIYGEEMHTFMVHVVLNEDVWLKIYVGWDDQNIWGDWSILEESTNQPRSTHKEILIWEYFVMLIYERLAFNI